MEKEIMKLTKEELLNVDTLCNIYKMASTTEDRISVKNQLMSLAKNYNVIGYVKTNLNKLEYHVEDVGLTYPITL